MKKMINKVNLYGKLYEMDLKKKVTGANSKNPGTEYITGTIGVATDDDCLNVVSVYYSYVVPMTKQNKPNNTYNVLENILNGVYGTVLGVGVNDAAVVRIDSQITLNEFYTDRNGKEELVSAKRIENGFIHVVGKNDIPPVNHNLFECDYMITNVRHIDENPERGTSEKAILKGAIFNDYNKTLMPMEFSVIKPQAINYFEGLNVNGNNPLFTRVKGHVVNEAIVRNVEEVSAWGEVSVKSVSSSRRDWVVDYSAEVPYDFGDDAILTVDEVNEAIKTREVMLANLKSRSAEYRASKGSITTPVVAASKEKFDF